MFWRSVRFHQNHVDTANIFPGCTIEIAGRLEKANLTNLQWSIIRENIFADMLEDHILLVEPGWTKSTYLSSWPVHGCDLPIRIGIKPKGAHSTLLCANRMSCIGLEWAGLLLLILELEKIAEPG